MDRCTTPGARRVRASRAGADAGSRRWAVDSSRHGARSDRRGDLPIAVVTLVDARGAERTAPVDDRGVAMFENLQPGTYQVKASADSFRPATAVQRAPRRQPRNRDVGRRHHRTDHRRPGSERRRSPRQRLHADAHAGSDRFAAGRSGRDGRRADAHGRPGRADLRQRLPRRPPAAEGSDSADSLPHQLVLGGVPRSRHDPRRGHHQARHGRLARP